MMEQLWLWPEEEACDGLTTHRLKKAANPLADSQRLQQCIVRWQNFLCQVMQCRISLMFTENKSAMVSFREYPSGFRLRLHYVFMDADEAIYLALARYMQDDPSALQILDDFIHHQMAWRLGRLMNKGKVHNLLALFQCLNQQYFHSACTACVTYGQPHKVKVVLSKHPQLSRYDLQSNAIIVNPCLDHAQIPHFYINYQLYGQMLAELYQWDCLKHPQEPKDLHYLKKCYPDHQRCLQWERDNLQHIEKYRYKNLRRGMRRIRDTLPSI